MRWSSYSETSAALAACTCEMYTRLMTFVHGGAFGGMELGILPIKTH